MGDEENYSFRAQEGRDWWEHAGREVPEGEEEDWEEGESYDGCERHGGGETSIAALRRKVLGVYAICPKTPECRPS